MKQHIRIIILCICFIFSGCYTYSQTQKDESNNDTEVHEHRKNEIGLAISPVYFLTENVFTLAMHLHYTYSIRETKFGIGASFERIFLNPKHSTFGLVLRYEPVHKLHLTISPGITIEDANPVALFGFHSEITYEFELGRFHIGPALEFAIDPNDSHLSLGVHLGYGF